MYTQSTMITYPQGGIETMRAVPDDEYLTVAEAATLLRVSQSTIWRWINEQELPAYRIGRRRIRVRRPDIARLITPARQTGQKPGSVAQKERLSLGPLTAKEQEQMLSAIEAAKRLQGELLTRRKGVPFSSSTDIIDQLRAQRARDLQ